MIHVHQGFVELHRLSNTGHDLRPDLQAFLIHVPEGKHAEHRGQDHCNHHENEAPGHLLTDTHVLSPRSGWTPQFCPAEYTMRHTLFTVASREKIHTRINVQPPSIGCIGRVLYWGPAIRKNSYPMAERGSPASVKLRHAEKRAGSDDRLHCSKLFVPLVVRSGTTELSCELDGRVSFHHTHACEALSTCHVTTMSNGRASRQIPAYLLENAPLRLQISHFGPIA